VNGNILDGKEILLGDRSAIYRPQEKVDGSKDMRQVKAAGEDVSMDWKSGTMALLKFIFGL
jgi:hypothetical protein